MPHSRRPRRTKAAVEDAIREAVLAEVAEHGYSALTFEGVARRAQVSKPVLYRRHATRVSLVLAAMKHTIESTYAVAPGTGSLRTDLQVWLAESEGHVGKVRASTLRGLIGEAGEAELQQINETMISRLDDMERCVLDPARERGEISGHIPPSVARLFFTLARDRALFGSNTIDDSSQVIDEVIVPLLEAHSATPIISAEERAAKEASA